MARVFSASTHYAGNARLKHGLLGLAAAASAALFSANAFAAELHVGASRSTLVKSARPMGEVIVADPEIADVHAHGTTYLSVVGKRPGRTTVRIFDKERKLLQTYDVEVDHDLVAIRKALKTFLPDEVIGVEMVGNNIALSGNVSSAEAAERAVKVASEFVKTGPSQNAAPAAANSETAEAEPTLLNLMKITTGQQVMLRVRVGEIQRSALKNLSVNLNGFTGSGVAGAFFGSGAAGLAGLITPVDQLGQDAAAGYGPGQFQFPSDTNGVPNNTQGLITTFWKPRGSHGITIGSALQALERDGLFKLLAEPNLVAISGEQAEFLAGGEIPIPVPQGGGTSNTVTIEYKPFGVAVKFRPFVLAENRIRMEVSPEVSELDAANALKFNGFTVPAISTRRAKTTVELAPGESFMIAGLIKDQTRSNIDQLPGVKELPILGALFRSTEFQRNETELVIAVTPYGVDPVKASDVRLPTDNFAPASQMEMFFYGALGTLSGNAYQLSQTPTAEGPIGFMVE